MCDVGVQLSSKPNMMPERCDLKPQTSNLKVYIPGSHGLPMPTLKGQGTATRIIKRAMKKNQKALLYFTLSGTDFFDIPYPNVIITIASTMNVGCSTQKNRKNRFFMILSPSGNVAVNIP